MQNTIFHNRKFELLISFVLSQKIKRASHQCLLNQFFLIQLFGLRGRDNHYDLAVSQFTMGKDEVVLSFNLLVTPTKHSEAVSNILVQITMQYFINNDLRLLSSNYQGIIREGKSYRRPIAGGVKFRRHNVGNNELENLMKSKWKQNICQQCLLVVPHQNIHNKQSHH